MGGGLTIMGMEAWEILVRKWAERTSIQPAQMMRWGCEERIREASL